MTDLPLGWIALPGAGEREDAYYRASAIVRVAEGSDGSCHVLMSNGHGHYVGVSAEAVIDQVGRAEAAERRADEITISSDAAIDIC